MSLLIVPLLYPDLAGLLNSSDLGDALCSDGILVSELINGMSDFDGLFRKIVANLKKASEQLHSPVVSDNKLRAAVLQWDIPRFKQRYPVNFSSSSPRSCSEHCRNCPAQSICTCSVTINSIFSARLNRSVPQGSPIEENCCRNMNTPAELLVPPLL